MILTQLELWPGHKDWAAKLNAKGWDTDVSLLPDGSLTLRGLKGRPDTSGGYTANNTVRTPNGNYKLEVVDKNT
jgi:hypothetical protein